MIDIIHLVTKVHEWLQHWHDDYGVKQGFSKETFNAIIQTTKGIPHLVDYLLDIKELDCVLLAFIQSDYLEQRFGWYRQLCVQIISIPPCNYYKLKTVFEFVLF